MTWGIFMNGNYMGCPQYCGQNRLLNMIMTYNMFQYFMNSLFNPQAAQPQMQQYCCMPALPSVFSAPVQRVNPYAQAYQSNSVAPQRFGQMFGSATYQNLIESDEFKEIFKSSPTQSIYPDLSLSRTRVQSADSPDTEDIIDEPVTKTKRKKKAKPGKDFKNPKKLGKDFLNRVKQIARSINCDYEDLLAVMNNESGIDPQCGLRSDGSVASAVGLIQFMDPAVQELNTNYNLNLTRAKIARMSAMEQLDLVEKLYKIIRKQRNIPDNQKIDAATLYAMVLLPSRCTKEVLAVKGEINPKTGKLLGYYEQNPMDDDNDGKLTKSDLNVRLDKRRVDESLFV